MARSPHAHGSEKNNMRIAILHKTSYRFAAIPKPPEETSKTW